MEPVKPSLIDRAVAMVSPRRAAKRLADRAAYGAIAAATTDPSGRIDRRSGYRAGQSDRRQTRNWEVRPRSANSDLIGRHEQLVGRARDAAMNLPPATAAIERNVDFAIGTGLMVIPDLDHEALGITRDEAAALTRQIRRDYDEYMESTDPDAERAMTGYAQQAVVLRGMLTSGDVLALRCWPDQQPGRVYNTAWKLVEADRVVSPIGHQDGDRLPNNGPVVVGGVELDEYGAAQAFHVLQKARALFLGRTANDTERYPAWGKVSKLPTALLVFDKQRPEQARGVPMLAPVLELIRVFADTTDAASLALLLQSMLAVVYKSPDASAMPEPEYGRGELVQSEGEPETVGERSAGKEIAFEAGTILELESEAEVELKVPGRDNPVYEKFFEALMTQIGAAIGTPFGVLMARFNSSYTASKGELELFYKQVTSRVSRFAPRWCGTIYQCWLYEQVTAGRYVMPGFLDDMRMRALWSACRYAGDGKITLDPVRDRKAYEIDEAHGWSTSQQIAAQINGSDFEANIETRGREHAMLREQGLPIPNAQGGGVAPATGGGRAPQNEDNQDE